MNMRGMTERNLRGVDLNLLVVFDALMAERNVTRAAQHNGLSQPAMSKALNRLRYLLDDRLFERRDGRMEPTARAFELAGPIHVALADISRTLTVQGAFDPRRFSGTIRIASIDLHQTSFLPALAARLRRDLPLLDLRIQVADRDRLYDQLAGGELDLAIATNLAGKADLLSEPLWKDRLVTLLGARNALPQPLTIEGFAAADHVVDAGHVRIGSDGQGASSRRRDPRRARAQTAHRPRPAEFRGVPLRRRGDRPRRHLAEPDRQGHGGHSRPARRAGALAADRSEPAPLLAPAHPEFPVAGMAARGDQGNDR